MKFLPWYQWGKIFNISIQNLYLATTVKDQNISIRSTFLLKTMENLKWILKKQLPTIPWRTVKKGNIFSVHVIWNISDFSTALSAPIGLAGQRLPYEHLYWHSSGPNLFILPAISIPYVSPVKGVNHYKIKMGAMHLSALHPLMRRSDLAHWESLSFVVVIVKAEVAHVKSSQILCLLVLNKVLTELSTTACSMSVNTVE